MLRRKLALSLLVFTVQLAPVAAREITVAVVGPMTGRLAEFGAQMRAGVEQAVSDLNAAGGVNGRRIRVTVEDDGCQPAKAVATAARLAARNVALVVGHFCSRASLPAAKLYAQAGIVQITPASSHRKLTDERAGATIFRLAGRDDWQGQQAGAYLAKQARNGAVAIVYEDTAFSQELAREARTILARSGQDQLLYEPLRTNIARVVAQMKLAAIKTVYFAGGAKTAARLIRQLRQQGMDTQLVGSDALATQEFWQETGIAAEGTIMTHLWDPRSSPSAKAVVTRLRTRRIAPEGYVLYAYAAVEAWAQAVEATQSIQASLVAKKLGTMTLVTVLGTFRFDKNGDPDLPLYALYRWQAGRFRPVN